MLHCLGPFETEAAALQYTAQSFSKLWVMPVEFKDVGEDLLPATGLWKETMENSKSKAPMSKGKRLEKNDVVKAGPYDCI